MSWMREVRQGTKQQSWYQTEPRLWLILSLSPAPPSVQSGPVYAGCTHTRLIWVSQGDSSFPLEKTREPGFLRARQQSQDWFLRPQSVAWGKKGTPWGLPQLALSKYAGLHLHTVPQALASTGTGWEEKKGTTLVLFSPILIMKKIEVKRGKVSCLKSQWIRDTTGSRCQVFQVPSNQPAFYFH